ncbi:MAG: class II aldolase/adducin family protein [Chloroflexota bacterium]
MPDYAPIKDSIVQTCRALLARGFLKATEGNISQRCSAPTGGALAFAITPSNYDYARMQVEDICVLDGQAGPIETPRKPSIESGMHAAVYAARPDVQAIIHTHQPYASALALINTPIPTLSDEQVMRLGRSVEIIPYGRSGTADLAGQVRRSVVTGANAFILQNHGALVLGAGMEQAVHNLLLLEKCALTYLLALLTGREISHIPEAAREMAFAKLMEDQQKLAGV